MTASHNEQLDLFAATEGSVQPEAVVDPVSAQNELSKIDGPFPAPANPYATKDARDEAIEARKSATAYTVAPELEDTMALAEEHFRKAVVGARAPKVGRTALGAATSETSETSDNTVPTSELSSAQQNANEVRARRAHAQEKREAKRFAARLARQVPRGTR